MCDFFWQAAENDQGDLTDILRSGGGHGGAGISSSSELSASDQWPIPTTTTDVQAATFPPSSSSSGDFGNPFPNFQDPLLTDLLHIPSEGNNGVNLGQEFIKTCSSKPCNIIMPRVGGGGGVVHHQMAVASGGMMRAIRPYPMIPGPPPPSIDGVAAGLHQISSPRGGPGMKRRKNQAKKVICIPAPAASTGGRPTGEVVPSDLWAWRKYGQKPIKGSPYPRGYYRCSSSKGCSARKQVERSRTDPNMLVITYTSEHNHPWPTQRNALAGSTRSQLTKSNSSSSSNKGFHQNTQKQQQQQQQQQQQEGRKETPKEEPSSENNTTTACRNNNVEKSIVKEEEMSVVGKPSDAAEDDDFGSQELLMDQYRPMIPDSSQPDDFFADLQELEADPMSLIFSKEYMEAKPDQEEKGGNVINNKGSVDPFNMFDWSNVGGSSYGEAKKG